MIQSDVRCALLPLLTEAMHPGIRRLAELAHASAPATAITAHLRPSAGQTSPGGSAVGVVGPFEHNQGILSAVRSQLIDRHAGPTLPSEAKLVEIERWSTEEVLLQAEVRSAGSNRPSHAVLAGWDTLRLLGGEVGELFVLASEGEEELGPQSVVLVSGQFVRGGLFQQTLLPCQSEARLRLALVTISGRAELFFPQGCPGPAELTYRDADGVVHRESWPASIPGPAWSSASKRKRPVGPRRGQPARSLRCSATRPAWAGKTRSGPWNWTTPRAAACTAAGPALWNIRRIPKKRASKVR